LSSVARNSFASFLRKSNVQMSEDSEPVRRIARTFRSVTRSGRPWACRWAERAPSGEHLVEHAAARTPSPGLKSSTFTAAVWPQPNGGGLQVAVDDAVLVGGFEGGGNLFRGGERLVQRDGSPGDAVSQRRRSTSSITIA
jgi:hypothetical protein